MAAYVPVDCDQVQNRIMNLFNQIDLRRTELRNLILLEDLVCFHQNYIQYGNYVSNYYYCSNNHHELKHSFKICTNLIRQMFQNLFKRG